MASSKSKTSGYKRVLLKISGEAFGGEKGAGLQVDEVVSIASQIKSAADLGTEIAVVVGGGNFIRGGAYSKAGINRVTADQMGMLATSINALALQDAVEKLGRETRVLSAIEMRSISEPFIRRRAVRHLEKGRIVILAGGTGNPYFTTDTTAALRATELGCQVVMKATKVDGVYSADPMKDKSATLFKKLSYMDCIQKQLKVMDTTAITLCMENHLPILVFNLRKSGNIERAVAGETVGTLIEG